MRTFLAICGSLVLTVNCGCFINRYSNKATNPHPFVFNNQMRATEQAMQSPNLKIQAEAANARSESTDRRSKLGRTRLSLSSGRSFRLCRAN